MQKLKYTITAVVETSSDDLEDVARLLENIREYGEVGDVKVEIVRGTLGPNS